MGTNHIIRIPIGDWSDDGHGVCKDYHIMSNYPVIKLQEAYKESCKLTGLQFNHNENYTGLIEHNKYGTERHICTEYEDTSLSSLALHILRDFRCPFNEIFEDEQINTTEQFVKILLWFIGLSMPQDFNYSFVEFQCLNGYWNDNLNVQFGYGLFS